MTAIEFYDDRPEIRRATLVKRERTTSAPPGFCQCGCGERTKRVKYGPQPEYVLGHQHRGRRCFLPDRLIEYVDFRAGECWQWVGGVGTLGYARIYSNSKRQYAHRVVYEAFCGPIAPGLVIDHLCRNRTCVNPAHLEAVTIAENNRRGEGTGGVLKTACRNGHPYTDESMYIDSSGFRKCRVCRKKHDSRRRKKAKS